MSGGARAVLIGAPGSGKTTVGRRVAERLGVDFIDVDAVIEARTGRTIGDIFATDGEDAFRRLEESTTLEVLAAPAVVALGGGAVLSAAIREAISAYPVVWLEVGVVQATRRVGMNALRPLLLGDVRSRLQTLLEQRLPLYEQASRIRVDTDGQRPAAVADQVCRELAALDPEEDW